MGLAARDRCTMRFGSTAKVLLKCKLKYYRISECGGRDVCKLIDGEGGWGSVVLM